MSCKISRTIESKVTLSLLIIPAFLIIASSCYSQNIVTANLVWETDQATDLQTQSTSSYKAQFKTNGSTSVEWVQRKGQMTTLYNVEHVEGEWADISTSGSITYFLTRNDKSAKMIIEKKSSGTFITLDFSVPGEFNSLQKFHVQSVQPAN